MQRIEQVHRGQRIAAAKRQQVPVVVSHSQAEPAVFFALGDRDQPTAPIVPHPGHQNMFFLLHREFVERKTHRRPHAVDGLAQEGHVPSPREVVRTAAQVQRIGDRMPRVDGGDQGFQIEMGSGGAVDEDAIAHQHPCITRLTIQRDVGILHAVRIPKRQKSDETLWLPVRLAFEQPCQLRLRL